MRLSSETTKSRSLEEVSKEIRAAGGQPQELKDESDAAKKDPRVGANTPNPADKVVVPPAATDDAVVVNPAEALVVEPPTPDKLTPQEMMQSPADLLNPPAQEPINPEADALSNQPDKNDPAPDGAPKPDEAVLKDMGADPQVTQAMKEAKQKQDEAAKQHAEAND